jgi:aspartate racemase
MKTTSHRKLGIIGGAGPYASALFYHMLCKAHYSKIHSEERSSTSMPEVVIINYPFTRGLTVSESQAHARLLCAELQYCIDLLAQQQVEKMAITCNTLHAFVSSLDLKRIELISIPALVMQTAIQQGLRKLLILATQTTRSSQLYCHPNLEAIFPFSEEQAIVDQVIDRILSGVLTETDSQLLCRLIKTIRERESIEGVVLGCTDLPVLHHSYPLKIGSLPLFDSIQIPAQALINKN